MVVQPAWKRVRSSSAISTNQQLTTLSIPYNPVFFSYAVITPTASTLYVEDSKLTPEVKSHLGDAVTIRPYGSIFGDIEALSAELTQTKEGETAPTKFLISTRASWALSQSLGGVDKVDEVRSPIGDAKAVKNEVELQGMRDCHVRDGAALTEYFAWLEDQLLTKGATVDEVDGADKLEAIRSYVFSLYAIQECANHCTGSTSASSASPSTLSRPPVPTPP
jgi:Xaa-Pro aminopeptidase